MKLLECDQYIHWHRLKDEVVVRDLFWCHPDAVKLCNACHLVFLIDNTFKTNRYRLPLLDIVGVTPTWMTFSAAFAYLEDRLLGVIVTDRDLTLMKVVNTVFPECTNLLCRFHIDKNVKAKCKSLIGQKNAWDYVMDTWGTLADCPSKEQFPECLQKFEMACSPWSMFVDYVCETWIIPHKEKFVIAWTNKVMHLGNTTTNRVESAHWSLKRILQNSLGDLCSRLLRVVSRYAINEIAVELDRIQYFGNDPSSCGCAIRSTHGLPCACELSRYAVVNIPLELVHMRLHFSDQGLCEAEVSIDDEIKTIRKRFKDVDVGDKVTLKSKLREIAYPEENSMFPPPSKVKTKGAPKKPMKRSERSTKRDPSYWEYIDSFHFVQSSNTSVKHNASSYEPPKPTRIIPMLDQFAPFIQGFIEDVVDIKADGNCGYRSIAALLGMDEESWPMVRNQLIKELDKWSHDYINLFGGTERFEQLRMSLHVDGFSQVSVDKWMDITYIGYVIASSQPPPNSSVHRMICVGHVFGNHFIQRCYGQAILFLRQSSGQVHTLVEYSNTLA
ncbi:hypothetical protein GmHk_06G016456 [Glycine max]|nr:hypothetical protein GmHk_06G016456 [Glycine max]